MYKALFPAALLLWHAGICLADAKKPVLPQKPTLSRTHIAFVYAGDLWLVKRTGGEARRLTSGVGVETDPMFSPDGSQIAFTGQYDGNLDVYVMPSDGGEPRRLTYHPGLDRVAGWAPDGKSVLFRSGRSSYSRFNKLFTVPLKGGYATALPLPMGEQGSFSPNGTHIAYVPFSNIRSAPGVYAAWKRYRGGLASPVWIARLEDSSVVKIPRRGSNDFCPMWVGDRVYFLSDRSGPTTLFAYDTGSKKVTQVLKNGDADILSASAGPGGIVYEQFGSIHIYDFDSGKSQPVDIRLTGDFPTLRPHFEKVARQIRNARISPTGVRAVFEARGEILTVPAKKGDVRNLTHTPGVAERDPAWSPNGKWIAYFSDESGEYALHIRDQRGQGETKTINLGNPPSFFYHPVWSPDSKKIAYTDKRLNVWYVDLAAKKPIRVDTDTYDSPFRGLDPSWSPDARWLTYTKQLKNHLRAVFVHDLKNGKNHQLTDGMSDARFAVFDKNGKYLYFTASTDIGPSTGWLDLSSMNRPVTRSVYVMVLGKDTPSPIPFESDEEKDEVKEGIQGPVRFADSEAEEAAARDPGRRGRGRGDKAKKEPVTVRIDLENIDQRILALPIPARDYAGLAAGKTGELFLLESGGGGGRGRGRGGFGGLTLQKFDLKERKTNRLLEGISSFDLSHDASKMLYRQGNRWIIARAGSSLPGGMRGMAGRLAAAAAAAGQAGAAERGGPSELRTDNMEIRVDPRAEWKQMYREVWRIERDFLYDPSHHGLNLIEAEKKYEPYLAGVASRADLNYLFNEMLGNITIGHLYIAGGDSPQVTPVRGGLLGADYHVENGRYRFARVYHGENWNPQLRAPLTQPGVNVKPGEYLLTVDGKEVRATDNLNRFFEGKAGRAVLLKVGPKPDGTGSRTVTVVPVETEVGLRNMAWVEGNRRKVSKLSNGRVAYMYLPDTSVGGYRNFNRYFFAQVGKAGAVVDERFNGGGSAADYIIDYLRRPLLNYWSTREGADFTTPLGSIFGPKVMIINEFAGSGGDAMPWYFRHAKVGPLVGKRTWGGLVGIYDYPQLVDGGFITAPRLAFWNPNGTWDVENHGVAPDIEVDLDPQAVREGHDPQLEKAVQVVLEELKKHPLPRHKKPAYPNYFKGQIGQGGGVGGGGGQGRGRQ
jgi:tricorn protease